MPESLGNLCHAQSGSGLWFPRNVRRAVLRMAVGRKPGEKARCDLSSLANLRSDVPSPVPSSTSVGQCPGWTQPAAPGCPRDMQPAQAAAHRGKDGHRVSRLVFSRKKIDDAKTISHNHWWSCRFITRGLAAAADWPNLWDLCVGRAPLPSAAVVRFCPAWALHDSDPPVSATKPPAIAVLPRARALQGYTRRCSPPPPVPPGLGCCKKLIQVSALGCHRAGLGLARLSPAASCCSPHPRASASRAGPATTSRIVFRGNAAFLRTAPLSPQRTERAGACSSPFARDLGWVVNTNAPPPVTEASARGATPHPRAPTCAGRSGGDAPRVPLSPDAPGLSPARPMATPLRSSPLYRNPVQEI